MSYIDDVYSNPTYPTKQEFQEAKRVMRENLGSLFDFTPKEKNPKLDELVARTVFGIQNGYQPLVAHWKATDYSKAELPKQWEKKDRIYLLMSIENNFYEIFDAENIKNKHGDFVLPNDIEIISDDDELQRYQQNDLVGEVLDHEYKALQKFYKVTHYHSKIPRVDRYGCPDISSNSAAHKEMVELGLLRKGEFMNVTVDETGGDEVMGIIIEMTKRDKI